MRERVNERVSGIFVEHRIPRHVHVKSPKHCAKLILVVNKNLILPIHCLILLNFIIEIGQHCFITSMNPYNQGFI